MVKLLIWVVICFVAYSWLKGRQRLAARRRAEELERERARGEWIEVEAEEISENRLS